MTTQTIRTVEELVELQRELTEELEWLLETSEGGQGLAKIKKLRQQLADLQDELRLSHNRATTEQKQKLIEATREYEKDAQQYHDRIQELSREALPKLKELLPVLAEIELSQKKLVTASQDAQRGKDNLSKQYGETIEVKTYGVALNLLVTPDRLKDYTRRIGGIVGEQPDKPSTTPEVKPKPTPPPVQPKEPEVKPNATNDGSISKQLDRQEREEFSFMQS